MWQTEPRFSLCLQAAPKCVQARCRVGEPTRGLDDARRAVALAPHYAKAHHRLGAALSALGREDEATDAFAAASSLQRAARPASPAQPRPAAALAAEARPCPPHWWAPLVRGLAHGQHLHMELAAQACMHVHMHVHTHMDMLGLGFARPRPDTPGDRPGTYGLQAAAALGELPWPLLTRAVRVHRLVGLREGRSQIAPGVLLPLPRCEWAAAEQLLLPCPCPCPSAAGTAGAAVWPPLGVLAAARTAPFIAAAALLDADAVVGGDAAADGELRAAPRVLRSARELREHVAMTSHGAAAARAAAALQKAGVRLLLARGSIDEELCACCASIGN